MKLLKTLIIALVGLAFTNCVNKADEQIQKLEPSSTLKVEQAKADFKANYGAHLKFVLKRSNQLRRNENISREVLQQEFESQWMDHLEKLKALHEVLSEEEVKAFLNQTFAEFKTQGVAATPCYDEYVKSLDESDGEFLLCTVIAVATGGEAIPVCVVYYLNGLRKAYADYTECMEKTYSGKE